MTPTKACHSRLFINLVSKFEDAEYDGVILDLAEQWCVLASIEEFNLDGYWIIRKDTIKQVRHRNYEAFRHQILKADGILAGLRSLEAIDISTTSHLFASLVRFQNYVIVYRESDTDWWMHHAALAFTNGKQVLMHSFDGAGRFNRTFSRCKMADISSIRIGSRYLQTYQKAAPYNFMDRRPVSQNL